MLGYFPMPIDAIWKFCLARPENARNWKFAEVSSTVSQPSQARVEEEKILLLVSNNILYKIN